MKDKILICSNVHWYNAEAAYALKCAKIFSKNGHEVHVLTRPNTLNESKLKKLNVPLITDIDLNTNNIFKLFLSYRKLKNLIKTEKYSIVNAFRSEGYIIIALLNYFLNSFKLIRTRGNTRAPKNNWGNRLLYEKLTDNHILCGEVVKKRLIERLTIEQSKLNVIYYPTYFPLIKDNHDYLTEFNIPKNAPLLAIVARIRPEKGHAILLKAFKQFLNDYPDSVLLILYRHTAPGDGYWEDINAVIDSLEIKNNIRLIGHRDDIRSIMKACDVGLIPSIFSEVICRVAVEYYSVGTPIIAFNTGCLSELVVPEKNGFITDKNDSTELYKTLLKVFPLKKDKLNLRDFSLKNAKQKFNETKFYEDTLKVYLK